jgi:hypothetical protein
MLAIDDKMKNRLASNEPMSIRLDLSNGSNDTEIAPRLFTTFAAPSGGTDKIVVNVR